MGKTIFFKTICRGLIFLFVYTAVSKLAGHTSFVRALGKSTPLNGLEQTISWLVPLAELTAAALLLFPRTVKEGLIISLNLMTAFTLYISYMMIFLPELPCTCGGIISKLSWKGHLVLNVVLTVLSFSGIILHRGPTRRTGHVEIKDK